MIGQLSITWYTGWNILVEEVPQPGMVGAVCEVDLRLSWLGFDGIPRPLRPSAYFSVGLD